MSTTPTAIPPLDDNFSKLEKRFEELKKESAALFTDFNAKLEQLADGGKTFQTSIETLSKAQEETIKKLNIASDEIRSLGGKILEKQITQPVIEVKKEMGLSMFDLFED